MGWQRQLHCLAELVFSNPFSRERIELEKQLLGSKFVSDTAAWSWREGQALSGRENLPLIFQRAEEVVRKFGESQAAGEGSSPEQQASYRDVLAYVLLYRHITSKGRSEWESPGGTARTWRAFAADFRQLMGEFAGDGSAGVDPGHLFACLVQVHRAFQNIYDFIIGESNPIIQLRERVWQSIFTHDMRAYREGLYQRLRDVPTLVTGATGTGKELVARAIGQSLYIPFDIHKERFASPVSSNFHPVNLSALSATLIESELFGHRRGSFTGAIGDRAGWLEACPPHGAVFLDEIGELELGIQVKLLRVTQERTYSRIGDTAERLFQGKLIAATNRDLKREISLGRFREDLYFRLCADQVSTPDLARQFRDRPDDLETLVRYISRKVAGPELAQRLCLHSMEWIERNLGRDYSWPGNIRELEQYVKGVMLRGPNASRHDSGDPPSPLWLEGANRCELTAEQLLGRYCTWAYFQLGTYERAAEQLGLDRRTVKARVIPELLSQLQGGVAVREALRES